MSTNLARTLRHNSTEAEKRVWHLLRSRQIGTKFRRQQPIEGYIVDFVSFDRRLVIEIDGGQHADASGYEERRTRCLEANGFRILRFWNNEVMENEEGVYETILTALRAAPAPSPSHARGVGPFLSREGRGKETSETKP
jgi:crossover junction endodeoxyribonuclease RuvC